MLLSDALFSSIFTLEKSKKYVFEGGVLNSSFSRESFEPFEATEAFLSSFVTAIATGDSQNTTGKLKRSEFLLLKLTYVSTSFLGFNFILRNLRNFSARFVRSDYANFRSGEMLLLNLIQTFSWHFIAYELTKT